MKKTYKSKIGIEIITPIFLIFSFSIYKIIYEPKPLAIIILILSLIFIIYILLSNRYTIEQKELKIRGGFISEKIDINKITKIEKTFNILASPASSLDRLQINYNNGNTILISPKNKLKFIEELKKINPNIEVK